LIFIIRKILIVYSRVNILQNVKRIVRHPLLSEVSRLRLAGVCPPAPLKGGKTFN
jgi:hypothetical protein